MLAILPGVSLAVLHELLDDWGELFILIPNRQSPIGDFELVVSAVSHLAIGIWQLAMGSAPWGERLP